MIDEIVMMLPKETTDSCYPKMFKVVLIIKGIAFGCLLWSFKNTNLFEANILFIFAKIYEGRESEGSIQIAMKESRSIVHMLLSANPTTSTLFESDAKKK